MHVDFHAGLKKCFCTYLYLCALIDNSLSTWASDLRHSIQDHEFCLLYFVGIAPKLLTFPRRLLRVNTRCNTMFHPQWRFLHVCGFWAILVSIMYARNAEQKIILKTPSSEMGSLYVMIVAIWMSHKTPPCTSLAGRMSPSSVNFSMVRSKRLDTFCVDNRLDSWPLSAEFDQESLREAARVQLCLLFLVVISYNYMSLNVADADLLPLGRYRFATGFRMIVCAFTKTTFNNRPKVGMRCGQVLGNVDISY